MFKNTYKVFIPLKIRQKGEPMGIFDKFTKNETVPMNSENINTGNVLNIEFNGFSCNVC